MFKKFEEFISESEVKLNEEVVPAAAKKVFAPYEKVFKKNGYKVTYGVDNQSGDYFLHGKGKKKVSFKSPDGPNGKSGKQEMIIPEFELYYTEEQIKQGDDVVTLYFDHTGYDEELTSPRQLENILDFSQFEQKH